MPRHCLANTFHDLNSPNIHIFMNYDLSVGELQQLPHQLDEEGERLEQELLDWSTEHSGLLLKSRTLSESIDSNLQKLRSLTNSLSSTSASLKKDFSIFHDYGFHKSRKKIQRNVTTLRHYPDLLRILELPHLLKTCITSDRYDEVIDLKEFCDSFIASSPYPYPVLKDIQTSIDNLMSQFIEKLLFVLKYDDSVPKVMTVFPLLRKLKVMDETQLKAVFLDYRSSFVLPKETMSSLDRNEAIGFQKLLRLSDTIAHPLRLFVFQYQTLFSISTSSSSSPNQSPKSSHDHHRKSKSSATEQKNKESTFLLIQCIYKNILSPTLEIFKLGISQIQHFEQLPILINNISKNLSIFSRIGLDSYLDILKTSIFNQIEEILKKRIVSIQDRYSENLKDKNLKKNEILLKNSFIQKTTKNKETDSLKHNLLAYFENGQFVNDCIRLFMDLRTCIPKEIDSKILEMFKNLLKFCRNSLKSKVVKFKNKIKKQKNYFVRFKNFDNFILPYIMEILEKLFDFDDIQKQEIINDIKEIELL